MTNPCLTGSYEDWFKNDCNEYAASAGQEFYNQLFQVTWPTQRLFIPGISLPEGLDNRLLFQGVVADTCNSGSNGRYCREPLLQLCSNYNRNDLYSPIVSRFCGCYLPVTNYDQTIPRVCDRICGNSSTLEYYETSEQINPQTCNVSVCLIDNLTLVAVGSSIGEINFIQTCPNCGVSNCRCIISDINLIVSDSRLGGLNLEQDCSGGISCFQTVNGFTEEVPCDQYIAAFGIPSTNTVQEKEALSIYAWSLLSTGIVLILLILIAVINLLIAKPRSVSIRVPSQNLSDLTQNGLKSSD